VSFIKAPRANDAHPGNSDPLDEQAFLVDTINHLESLPTWSSTAVVIVYDDAGGWYDHQLAPVLRQSQTPLDTLSGPAACGSQASKVPTGDAGTPEQARCGLGPRLPLLVISPYARRNFVDSTLTDQSSILRFIEDNWLGGQRLGNGSSDASAGSLENVFDFDRGRSNPPLFLDPSSGEPRRPGR
jgi:phospholipase C